MIIFFFLLFPFFYFFSFIYLFIFFYFFSFFSFQTLFPPLCNKRSFHMKFSIEPLLRLGIVVVHVYTYTWITSTSLRVNTLVSQMCAYVYRSTYARREQQDEINNRSARMKTRGKKKKEERKILFDRYSIKWNSLFTLDDSHRHFYVSSSSSDNSRGSEETMVNFNVNTRVSITNYIYMHRWLRVRIDWRRNKNYLGMHDRRDSSNEEQQFRRQVFFSS